MTQSILQWNIRGLRSNYEELKIIFNGMILALPVYRKLCYQPIIITLA